MSKLAINFENVLTIKNELNKPLKEIFSLLKASGISALDIMYDKVENQSYLSEILTSNFEISTIFHMSNLGVKDNFSKEMEIIDFCFLHKIKRIFLITNPVYKEGDNEYLKNLVQNLKRIVKYAKNYGIKICIENFGTESSPFSTLNRVVGILKKVKGLGLVFDTGNFVLAGESPKNCLTELIEYISSVHLKDRGKAIDDSKFISIDIKGNKTCVYALGNGESEINEVYTILNGFNKNFDYCLEFDFKSQRIYDEVVNSAMYYLTELK